MGEQLKNWAKKMGFSPETKLSASGEYPSADQFQKLCKGKTSRLWQNIIQNVKTREEVMHIQKNLLLKRLMSEKSLADSPVSGHISTQLTLESELLLRHNRKEELLESVLKRELKIQSQEKLLRKSAQKVLELEQQADEYIKKQVLFKIKINKCRSTLRALKQLKTIGDDLCPPSPEAEPSQPSSARSAAAVLRECVDAVRDYFTQTSDKRTSEGIKEAHLKYLWEQISFKTSGWGAQQLWDAATVDLLVEILNEIAKYASPGSVGEGEPDQRIDESSVQIKKARTMLPAIHMSAILECINLDTKIAIKATELEKSQRKLVAEFEHYLAHGNSKNAVNFEDLQHIVKVWVEAQSKKVLLLAKLQDIKIELGNIKCDKQRFFNLTSQLKAANEELMKLQLQMDFDKENIEDSLAGINMVGCRLRSAQVKVIEQRSNFNSQMPILMQCRQHYLHSDGDSSSPERKAPLSSTMISDGTTDSLFSIDTTAISCDPQAEILGGSSNLSEALAILGDSVSKEAKLFIKLRLQTIPFVLMNGRERFSECDLLVQAPVMAPNSSSVSQRQWQQVLEDAPFFTSPQIILNQLCKLSHFRALNVHQLLTGSKPPSILGAPNILEVVKSQSVNQEEHIQGKVDEVKAELDDIQELLSSCQNNLKFWIERPIQNAILSNQKVNGLTFSEWCKKYESECIS